MSCFVTVGSTKFDSLVQKVLSTSFLTALRQKGYTKLVVQCGASSFDAASDLASGNAVRIERDGVSIELWRYKATLEAEFSGADLVIGHAGSGTILDVLRLGKPLIVVPNPTLLDNHQEDLSSALSVLGHLKASSVSSLPQTVKELDLSTLVPFPAFDGSRFRNLLDEEMGFI